MTVARTDRDAEKRLHSMCASKEGGVICLGLACKCKQTHELIRHSTGSGTQKVTGILERLKITTSRHAEYASLESHDAQRYGQRLLHFGIAKNESSKT